jgi:hypothetical protein
LTEKGKDAQMQEPTEVTEEDIVEERPSDSAAAAVPLQPRSEADEPPQTKEVEQAVENLFVAVLHGPLTKYIGVSVLLHIVFIVLFSIPSWVSSGTPPAKKGTETAASETAETAKADEKPEAGRDPLSQGAREERAKKLLGHETAKPSEIPTKPDVSEIDELEALE